MFFRVHIVHTPASDPMFRVCGVPERAIRLYGGAADYGGPRTALRGLFWVFILVCSSVGFRVHHFMVAKTAYNMIRSLFFRSTWCCGWSGIFALIPVHAGMRGERHDMATDPEQTMCSAEPGQSAGGVGFEGGL